MDLTRINGMLTPTERLEKGSTSEARPAGAANVPDSSGDTVKISDKGKLYAQALRDSQEVEGVRKELVASLKEQIQAGTYAPDARKIAEGLLKSELEFLI